MYRMISIFISLISMYMILSLIFSIIPVNRDVESNNEIDIYIISNGVHLDIVMPLKNEIKDWTTEIWIDNSIVQSANYISFGLGDKGFYLNTPEWSDLTLKTTINALSDFSFKRNVLLRN